MPSGEKLERLLNLTAALLETRRPLTRSEIGRKVPGYPEDEVAFRRAFERDKDDLREMGIPLQLKEVPGSDPPIDGYLIPKDQYYLKDPKLEPDELAALHLAASAVRLDGIEGGGALWKLGGVPTTPGAARAAEVAPLPADPNLPKLFNAVAEQRRATFHYRGEERRVDPYRLDFARGRWYVTGFDHLRDEERNFRVARIESEVALGAPRSFERPSTSVPGVQLQPWELGEGDPVQARVLVDADNAGMARLAAGPGVEVEETDDGAVVLTFPVTNRDGFRAFVLGFLDHAEVLSPPELRDEVVAWLSALASDPA